MLAQLIERVLQIVELLPGFAQLSFRSEALIIGKVLAGLRNQPIEILRGLWCARGFSGGSRRFRCTQS